VQSNFQQVVQDSDKTFLTKCELITMLVLLTRKILYSVTIKYKLIFEGRNALCLINF
jgi:hypothetical protein